MLGDILALQEQAQVQVAVIHHPVLVTFLARDHGAGVVIRVRRRRAAGEIGKAGLQQILEAADRVTVQFGVAAAL